ncbi:MAG: hypothetical protein AAGA77_04745 [Bacteroidota bacterium]
MKNLLLLAFLCIACTANSQTEMWNKKVSKGAFMTQLEDGKIFLKDKTTIALVSNVTGEVEWENKVATEDNPRFLDNLPIMYFEGKSYAVIDATTGFVIDESKQKTAILNISYYWDEGRAIIEMDRNKNLHILNIDLNDVSKSWNSKIGPVQKAVFGLVSRESTNQPELTNDGSVVLVDKKFISIVDPNGAIKERIEYNKKLKKQGFNREKGILYVLEDNKKLHFIDVTTGKTNATKEMKEDKLMLNVLGDGSTVNVVQKKEFIILDAITGEEKGRHQFKDKIKQVYIDVDHGGLFALSKKMIAEMDQNSGKVKKETTFEKDFNNIYKVYDKTIISGHSGASPIDLTSLKLEYRKLPNIPPVHDYIEMGTYVAYTYQIQDKFSLNVVDTKGKVVWDKSFSSPTPPSLDVIGNGLLMVSSSEASYLSFSEGKSKWKENVKVDPSFTYGIDEKTKDMYMYSDKRLYIFDYSSGAISKSKEKFKFKDFDYETQQPQLLVLPDAVFLKGSNTVFVLSKKGELVHKNTYSRVSSGSTFLKLANAAVNVTTIASGNAHKVMTVYNEDGSVAYKGSMVDNINDSWDYAEGLKDERRAKQNRSSNAYPYVFTKMDSGKRGLIFINPTNGDERFSVLLDEKDPNYIVDDIDGVLFHLSKTSLKAYDVK